MENATKALLIAGVVFVVILIIAIGIRIFGSTQGVTNEVDKVAGATAISVHNSQFTDYEGMQTGAQVKALLNKVAATHRSGNIHTVNVISGEASYSSADDIASYRANIKINSNYNVTVGYDFEGYVNKVNIQEQ